MDYFSDMGESFRLLRIGQKFRSAQSVDSDMEPEALATAARARARGGYLTLRRTLSSALVDTRRGIDTSREVDLAQLGVAGPGRVRYEPSGWRDLARALKPQDVEPDDVFIDLGAGKGRIVLAAARYPFRRVMGVELAPALAEVARRNIEASRPRLQCQNVTIETGDLATFTLPDDVTVAYNYNAVRGDVFEAVMRELIASYDRRPRRLRLIYRTALEHDRLIATGRFRMVKMVPGRRPGRKWSEKMATRVYEMV